ncbi:ATP-binding protein [Streptomyces sp. CB03911]|jgi:anti-sigma regulatory factor (Ser/Thr protein kinase)|uniref:ATP-binding protein n=1 Tax=Streptomycetaceae TaxID=2062 RepID=UPI000A5B1A07|nr:ATP-binding protein [Streptomyces sp. CB03911]
MAGWGEAEQSSHPGSGLLGDASSENRPLALAALERLSPTELEQVYFGRMCEQDGSDEVVLPSRPQSASVARRLVLSVLQSWGLHQLLEAGELLAGELIANAVRHAAGRTIGLQVQRRAGWLRVEVRDSSRALPCRIVAEPGGEAGYGLQLVDDLADRWGADLLPRGKAVWFELKIRERG